ncbi:MarR family winged helix-turn-helix transcriptional regulator [Paenibacillus ginsengihumi]|uniref:MarR family winged helix-turn-helix transcriptional regulator n=1 Tax=Paenibacillus ginsengihumi TaxID=431596 RepID=UPI00036637F7|nr:MarR family transcriptional regulator [Paenibacillus ginsengihumi]
MYDYYFFEKLESLHRDIQAKIYAEWNAVSPVKLSIPQTGLLQMLERGGTKTLTELAEKLYATVEGVSLLCAGLEEKGLVRRIRSEALQEDSVELTPAGWKLTRLLRGLKGELAERMAKDIPVEEWRRVDRLLAAVKRNMSENIRVEETENG